MSLILAGCVSSGNVGDLLNRPMPPIPAELRNCFDHTVPAPPDGPMNKRQIAQLVASLKKSELTKTQCGQRLIAWYECLASAQVGERCDVVPIEPKK